MSHVGNHVDNELHSLSSIISALLKESVTSVGIYLILLKERERWKERQTDSKEGLLSLE